MTKIIFIELSITLPNTSVFPPFREGVSKSFSHIPEWFWNVPSRSKRHDYTDKSNLPAARATAVWKYKMIYIVNDEVVGSWSDVVSVTGRWKS